MQTLSNTYDQTTLSNQNCATFSSVGRELSSDELQAVSGGSYNASLGAAVSLVVAGAAIAGAAPIMAGALLVGSIGASGVAIFRSWHNLDES